MISRDEAFALVEERIGQRNLVNHSVATEIIMRALAECLGESAENVERWAIAGLLHDLDYAQTADDPARHGLITADELVGQIDDEMLHAILAHAEKAPRETPMDRALWCADSIARSSERLTKSITRRRSLWMMASISAVAVMVT